MKKIHLAIASNSLAFLIIGLYFDKIVTYFGVSSIIAFGIIIVALIFAIIPTLFVRELYEEKSESSHEWTKRKGIFGWRKESGVTITYHSNLYSIVKLFGIIPITQPMLIKSSSSNHLSEDIEIDNGRIKDFTDVIVSFIPIINGWLIQNRTPEN